MALALGYEVGPSAYSPVGFGWRYGGLVGVAALPVWFAMRYRLAAPLLALVPTTGYVPGMELASPGPTFRDVAEPEGLAEPTGITVVEDGLYVVRYTVDASVWTDGFLFVGPLEYAVRTLRDWLSGGVEALLYLFGAVGMWLLAAVPAYLFVRYRLVAPAALLTAFVLLDVGAKFTAGLEAPTPSTSAGGSSSWASRSSPPVSSTGSEGSAIPVAGVALVSPGAVSSR